MPYFSACDWAKASTAMPEPLAMAALTALYELATSDSPYAGLESHQTGLDVVRRGDGQSKLFEKL